MEALESWHGQFPLRAASLFVGLEHVRRTSTFTAGLVVIAL